MSRIAFKMKILPGQRAEYKKRHDEIWPELVALLGSHGVYDYSIFLDEQNDTLFAVQNRREGHSADELPTVELMQRWFRHMDGLLVLKSDGSPLVEPLVEVFHMD